MYTHLKSFNVHTALVTVDYGPRVHRKDYLILYKNKEKYSVVRSRGLLPNICSQDRAVTVLHLVLVCNSDLHMYFTPHKTTYLTVPMGAFRWRTQHSASDQPS